MSDKVVHLIQNQDPYGDTDVWCSTQFPREYSDLVAKITCEDCLRGFLQQAKVVELRLTTLIMQRREK